MRVQLLALFLCFASVCFSQNLVVNGGFERQQPKTAGVWQVLPKICEFSSQSAILNATAEGWRTFDSQTPDLLLVDSTVACPLFPAPRRGQKMVGLIMYHPFQDGQFAFDYHEMIQGTLARPMEKGKTYRVGFWVFTDDSLGIKHLVKVFGGEASAKARAERIKQGGFRTVFCGNFGFYFSNNKIQTQEEFMQSQITFPVAPQLNYSGIIEAGGGWQKITMTFTADQPYRYFLFGNFYSDAVTPINMGETERMQLDESNQNLPFWSKYKRIGYYLFDDFSVVEDNEQTIEKALAKDKMFAFSAPLLFETGKAELRPEALPAIDGLAAALLKNSGWKLEIGGHTDNVGDEKTNQELSEQRALAVYNALINKKVANHQISWKGYGESRPIAANDTEAGRQKNRRVECRLAE